MHNGQTPAKRLGGRSLLNLVISLSIAVPIAVLVLLQGGFFDLAPCVVGVISSVVAFVVWLRRDHRAQPVSLTALALFFLAVSYALSSLVNGATITTLAKAGSWATCAAVALLSCAQTESNRAATLRMLTWFGVATAVMGFLVYAQVLPLVGGVTSNRLEFTFQYANAAAIWFGIVSLMCLLGTDARARTCAALPVAAMLLTQSAGAVLVFLLVVALTGAWLARKNQWDLILVSLVQGAVGVGLFATMLLVGSPVALVGLVAVVGACYALDRNAGKLLDKINPRLMACIIAALILVAFVIAVVLMPGRVQRALYSLSERTYHVHDGIALWLTEPVFGVGPNNWQYLFRYVQTGPYTATVIHSSFVQVLCDAGIVGFAFLVLACAVGVRALVACARADDKENHVFTTDGSVGCSTWSLAQLTATALLLIHSVMEFDLQFAALSCMLAFLLCEPRLQVTLARIPARGLAAATASAVTCALCATGVVSAATTTLLAQSNARGAFAQTERIFWTNPLAMADPAAQDAHVEACFKREDYKGVCTSYELMPVPSDASVLYAATAMHAQGNRAGAAKVLAERLMATPYDEGLLESAKRFANTLGVESSQREQFDAAIARSEDLITKSDLLRARESSWAVADGVTKEGSK